MITFFSHYYHLCIIILGSSLIGIISGILGTFVFLRKQSLLGDAISHAALPGIVLALLLTSNKNPLVLLIGGTISGTIGMILAAIITHITRIHSDTVLGVILSTFFGCGLLLLSIVQKYPRSDQAVLNKFLFGNIAILLPSDLWLMAIIGTIVISSVICFWKELKLYTFDQNFCSLTYNTQLINAILTILLIMVIAIGMQSVGVILMSSLLIAPAAAARQWTMHLETTIILASFFGIFSAIAGTLISNSLYIPTGPTIVVTISSIVALSLFLSPRRNLLRHLLTKKE